MLQLMMEVPLVVAALAAGLVVLHVVRRRVGVAEGRAVALVIRVRTADGNGRRELVHARRLLVLDDLLLLLLLLHRARGRLLRLLLADRLPLSLVAALAARLARTAAVCLLLPLTAATKGKPIDPVRRGLQLWHAKRRDSLMLHTLIWAL